MTLGKVEELWRREGVIVNRYLLVRNPKAIDGPILIIRADDENEIAAVKHIEAEFVGEISSHLSFAELKKGIVYSKRAERRRFRQRFIEK